MILLKTAIYSKKFSKLAIDEESLLVVHSLTAKSCSPQ